MKPSTALITGASRGIGREIARTLASEGWHVLCGVRDPKSALPGTHRAVVDVADPESIGALATRLRARNQLEKELGARGLKQAQAAKLLGISQPRVSDLLRGRVRLFSADALIDMLACLGVKVRVVTSARKRVA